MNETPVIEKKTTKRSLVIRITAAVLVIGLIATAGLVEASRVVFTSAGKANDAETGAAQYIEESTSYLDEGTIARMGDVLYAFLSDPVTYEDYYLRLSVSISKEKYDDAAEYCAKCIELYKNGNDETLADLYIKLGCLEALRGDYGAARAGFDGALAITPDNSTVVLLRAQMSAQLGDAESALADVAKYEELTGDETSLLSVKGPLYEMTGEYALAAECYTKELEGADADVSLYASRARCRMLTGDYAGARADAEEYFALGGTDGDGVTSYILAACLMNGGDYSGAETRFLSAIENGYAEVAEAYTQVLYCRYMLTDYSAAIEAGELAVSNGGGSAELYEWMGIAEMGLSNFELAEGYFDKSMELDDTITDIYYYRGVCRVALADYGNAVDDFTVSIDRGESVGQCAYNRGVCLASLGDYAGALEDMDRAILNSDGNELTASATELRDQLAAALGQTGEAGE